MKTVLSDVVQTEEHEGIQEYKDPRDPREQQDPKETRVPQDPKEPRETSDLED